MKILLLTDEVWNDKLYTNNVLTNWFDGFPAKVANIYLASGKPDNNLCSNYFQITDKMMFKSLFTKEKAGKCFTLDTTSKDKNTPELTNDAFYSFIKGITTESLRLLRDFIWMNGKYDLIGLNKFITDFSPDIIFSLRLASIKMLRFERKVAELTKKPFVVFTGDDEYTLKQIRVSPIYWLRRLLLRKDFRNTVSLYHKYYTLSKKQAELYKYLFGLDTNILMKCGEFNEIYTSKSIHSPIRLIYAGRLYCNRWKTLVKIKHALITINQNHIQMTLEIYSKDKITYFLKKQLEDGVNSFLMPCVTAKELKEIYKDSDIALHVEAFDLKNRLLTKYSFSTKIIDCLTSTCAVIVISSKEHPGYEYLKEKDGAICIGNLANIDSYLNKIIKHPRLLQIYQKKAWECGNQNHKKTIVQEKLYLDINQIMLQFSLTAEL